MENKNYPDKELCMSYIHEGFGSLLDGDVENASNQLILAREIYDKLPEELQKDKSAGLSLESGINELEKSVSRRKE